VSNINAELILAWARAAEMRGETAEAKRLLDMAVREEDHMSAGREHYERRRAQAAAAQKPRLKSKHDYDWKKES
jgi:hypothetical protein